MEIIDLISFSQTESPILIDDSPILNQSETEFGSFKEAEESELIGVEFNSEEEAYQAYCGYAYRKCFGIRRDRLRKGVNGNVLGRAFVCSKYGSKVKKGTYGKDYTKLDRRTDCKAMAYFKNDGDKYLCTRHDMIHNHDFCHPNEVHNLRCHRGIEANEVEYLVQLRNNGIGLADAIRSLRKEAGGSPALGFGYEDAASAVKKAVNKKFDVTDFNSFINLLKQRAASEEDFYYDFEMDEDNCLVSIFFRDKKMREDYEAFPELLGNDGTYCTNKYGLVCAPFVGINHHTRICMFSIGFMMTERIESFKWLYTTFLASMGGIQPKTIMTDQSAAMASAIKTCFPQSKHRLCIWHLFKNSSAHLRSLKNKEGFQKLFNRMMKRCHTDAELEYCWDRMKKEYNCENHPWLSKLYDIREKWCCAYGKEYFSAGVLSSQRSESANHSISKNLNKTTGLCDFYHIFGAVVSKWRSNERRDNTHCWDGVPEVSIQCTLLLAAAKQYTIGAFQRFQKEFLKAMSYTHKIEMSIENTHCYFVSPTTHTDEFGHYVTYDSYSHHSSCTCKKFEESGFLCRHILKIYICNSVAEVPSFYILKRWTRDAKPKDDITEGKRGKIVGSVWRLDMCRKFHKLIIASLGNETTRGIVINTFNRARFEVEAVLGGIDFSDGERDQETNGPDIIQNPKGSIKKGEKFTRKRSIIDIQTARASAKYKAANTRAKRQAVSHSDRDQPHGAASDFNPIIPRHMGLRQILMND